MSRGRGEAFSFISLCFQKLQIRIRDAMMRHMRCASLGNWHRDAGTCPWYEGYKLDAQLR